MVLVVIESMVPMMEGRARDDFFERAEAPTHIGVDEEAPKRTDNEHNGRHQVGFGPTGEARPVA